MGSSKFQQLKLLIWKNFVLQKRRKIGTIMELAIPSLFFLILIAIRFIRRAETEPAVSYCSGYTTPYDYPRPYFNATNPATGTSGVCSEIFQSIKINDDNETGYDAIAYAPDTLATRAIMSTFAEQFTMLPSGFPMSYIGFNTTEGIDAITDSKTHTYLLAFVFQEDDNGSPGALGLSPRKIHYSIRFPDAYATGDGWLTKLNFPRIVVIEPRDSTPYVTSQFLIMQSSMDLAITRFLKADSSVFPDFVARMKAFPFPEYLFDDFIINIQRTLPLLLVLSLLYTVISIVRELVFEKEQRMREAMKMMGLSNWILWLSWFIKNTLFTLVSVIIILIMMKAGNITRYADAGVIFLFLFLFALSTIMFCFMVSTFFSRASVASAAAGLLYFLSYAPYSYMAVIYENLDSSAKTAGCILAPTCVGIGANIIALFEARGEGVKGSNLSEHPSEGDDFTMNNVLGMLVLDCFLYGIVAWYIDAVFPGAYGVPRKPYFFLQSSYWRGSKSKNSVSINRSQSNWQLLPPSESDVRDVEPDPLDMHAGIKISHLRKVFAADKIAVQDLTLNMYEGQITALLGHNGAGKTTTMSMLVGLLPPTSGHAFINDYDVATELDGARQSLGLCPQFDILFDALTVEEHIYFFSRLKGSQSDITQEINQFVSDLDLEAKRTALAGTLSGGQKRALSVGVAFCGGSKVVILDEPTSGMDPFKRRHTWEVLLKYKAGRTILLTTHFMDEADLLCDRIAILADGQLRCVGTSTFLKSKFGTGYHMTLVKEASCDSNAVKQTVLSVIDDAQCVSDIGSELAFVLPFAKVSLFPLLFDRIDARKEELAISSYGISVTTLEDVFLEVGHIKTAKEAPEPKAKPSLTTTSQSTLLTGKALLWQQFNGMLIKRVLYSLRSRSSVFAQFILPVFFLMIALLIAGVDNKTGSQPSRPLQLLDYYGDSNALVSSRDLSFDQYSNAYKSESSMDALRVLGAAAATSQTTQAKQAYINWAQNDPTAATITMTDITGQNMTERHLEDADDFLSSNYFKNNFIGASFARGAFRIYPGNSSECLVLVDGSPVSAYEFTLTAGARYGFHFIGSPSVFAISTDQNQATPSLIAQNSGSAPSESGLYAYTAPNWRYIEWQIDDARANSQVYLHCGGPSGSRINIVDTNTPDTPPTGIIGFAWYNQQALHTIAVSLNALSNSFAQMFVAPDVEIHTYNHPLPKSAESKINALLSGAVGLIIAIFALFGVGFMQASFAVFITAERVSKSKHIQFVSGVRAWLFWAASFLWDFAVVVIAACLSVFVIALIDNPAYRGDRIGLIFLLFILFAFSGLPLVYCLSYLFKTPSSAYSRLAILFIFGGLGMLVAVFVTSLPDLNLQSESKGMKVAFLLYPGFAFAQAIYDIYLNYNYHDACDANADAYADCQRFGFLPQDYLSMTFPGIGLHCVLLFVSGIVYFLLLAFIESSLLRRKSESKRQNTSTISDEDSDVAAERERAEMTSPSTDLVQVRGLAKVFRTPANPSFRAVDNLSFGITRGECFGLLGVNGAGKSTTFSMLTGETPMTQGSVSLNGYDVYSQVSQAHRYMGYCPQYDGLIGLLTAREHLQMFGRLRGVPTHELDGVVSNLLMHLGLNELADKPSQTYSGGNKRKLSTAIALIGDPPIVFLDEPTTGMDPGSRRQLWETLQAVVASGRSIVLTSHSMEECEALCTRVAIMVNGRFKCIGSVQHLKSKFGQGFRLVLKLRPVDGKAADSSALKSYVSKHFPGAVLSEEHYGELTYQVANSTLSLSELFTRLETAREQFDLADQSISQTTLEQVFLSFAKYQNSERADEQVVQVTEL